MGLQFRQQGLGLGTQFADTQLLHLVVTSQRINSPSWLASQHHGSTYFFLSQLENLAVAGVSRMYSTSGFGAHKSSRGTRRWSVSDITWDIGRKFGPLLVTTPILLRLFLRFIRVCTAIRVDLSYLVAEKHVYFFEFFATQDSIVICVGCGSPLLPSALHYCWMKYMVDCIWGYAWSLAHRIEKDCPPALLHSAFIASEDRGNHEHE